MFSQDRFKQFIKQCYKTQTAFANEIGMSHTEISFYLNDNRKPGAEILAKFYEAGLNLDWLFAAIKTCFWFNIISLIFL